MDIREFGVQLSDIVRDTEELLIVNDEAHHINDSKIQRKMYKISKNLAFTSRCRARPV